MIRYMSEPGSGGKFVGRLRTHDSMTVTQKAFDTEAGRAAVRYEFIYSVLGLALGMACVVFGSVLLIHLGNTANTKSWKATFLGFHSSAYGVPAGILFVLVGLFIVAITAYRLKVTR
jgi:hypothetical protein